MTDPERLDWLDEPGYTKCRMDNVLVRMRGVGIRAAIEAAKLWEDDMREEATAPAQTPLDRLEKWLQADSVDRAAVLYVNPETDGWSVELWGHDYTVGYGVAPTPDAAILAALAQAEGER